MDFIEKSNFGHELATTSFLINNIETVRWQYPRLLLWRLEGIIIMIIIRGSARRE